MKPTHVYIDGFNLYYGCLRDTPYKWLDVKTLCNLLLKENRVDKIKYFTARVSSRFPGDMCSLHQETYLRALRTIPNLEIYFGLFKSKPVTMRLAVPLGGQNYASVIKTEEKGTDVNLASHLLVDAAKGKFEVAVVISNDSDLVAPIMMAKSEFGKEVGILNPGQSQARELVNLANFTRPIRKGVLAASQFPDRIPDNVGFVHKPRKWG